MTTRTAGFDALDIGALHDSTALMTMLLMAIGGDRTSTAGGITVATFVVLIRAALAVFRRRSAIHAVGRSLRREEVTKVLSLSPCLTSR